MSEDQEFQNKPAEKVQEQRPDQDDESSGQGFYDDEREQVPEAPTKKMRKSKMIKKKRARGETSKKQSQQKKRKQHLLAANQNAKKIIDEMRNCYEKDLRLYEAKKKANHKLRYSLELEKLLHNVYVCEQFLQNGGLQCFVTWLQKLPDGTDSSLTLKKKVFNILLSMNVSDEHIDRAPELKKLIQRGKRNPMTKDLCESIINRWGGSLM